MILNSMWPPTKDGLIAAVEPSDLKSVFKMQQAMEPAEPSITAISSEPYERVCSPGADVFAVWYRANILLSLDRAVNLFTRELPSAVEDVIFKVAAKFPMKRIEPGVEYQSLPLDLDGFVKQIGHDLEVG
jgi:hypothetical protein